MTVARVTDSDLAECLAFIERYAPVAMFPLTNFKDHGLASAENTAPRAMQFYALKEQGKILAVLAQSNEGGLFPVFATVPPERYIAFLPAIQRPVIGMLGSQEQVRAFLDVLDIKAPRKLDVDEPQLKLELDQLSPPKDPSLCLSPITQELTDIATEWRAEFNITLLNEPPEQARSTSKREIETYIARDSHRVLLSDGQPVAMTGFNARYEDHVQIGAVFTPPKLRGRGYAGAAVALHLTEARAQGVTTAVLSAASSAAASVYRRIGFKDCGRYAIVLFDREEAQA
ncbi:MAG: GNAT family N-acetyltransferase [Pseudomonadota bacterium]